VCCPGAGDGGPSRYWLSAADVAEATRTILPALAPESLLVALQNGIAHHPILTELLHASWALGVTAQGATLLGPGQVRHGGDGPTILGFLGEVDNAAHGRLQAATDLLCRAGIATTVSHDIRAAAWNKLIVNAGINALTAIENCANGELLNRPAALATLKAAVLEAAKVAKACGIQVNPDPVSMTVSVCLQTRNNISSMLQDIRQGRQTEVEAINGAILRQAQTLGIPAPVNQALLLGVKGLERKGDEQP